MLLNWAIACCSGSWQHMCKVLHDSIVQNATDTCRNKPRHDRFASYLFHIELQSECLMSYVLRMQLYVGDLGNLKFQTPYKYNGKRWLMGSRYLGVSGQVPSHA